MAALLRHRAGPLGNAGPAVLPVVSITTLLPPLVDPAVAVARLRRPRVASAY
ncbi:MAG TPA: hypothetical protein VNC82_12665 [Candidatus Limnocylindria bacterium]|nr:hypothetical protein [Candidatus Limnocylindria bacterium]